MKSLKVSMNRLALTQVEMIGMTSDIGETIEFTKNLITDQEEKQLRRCFDQADDLCGEDQMDEDKCPLNEKVINCNRNRKISVAKLNYLISRLEDPDHLLYVGPVVNKMDQPGKINSVKQAIEDVDLDNDGFISFDEFKLHVQSVKRGKILQHQHSRSSSFFLTCSIVYLQFLQQAGRGVRVLQDNWTRHKDQEMAPTHLHSHHEHRPTWLLRRLQD